MRRKDRQRDDISFMHQVLDNAETLFLAFAREDYPYCLPLNFARINNFLYIHSALEGYKLDLLARDGHVAFAAAVDMRIDRQKATTYYRSVSGIGDAAIILDLPEKCRALEAIGQKYAAICPVPCPESTAMRVSIIRVAIIKMSGKESVPRQ